MMRALTAATVLVFAALVLWRNVQTAAPSPVTAVAAPTLACAADDLTLACPPALSAVQLDAILASYGSPAAGTGARC